MATEKRPKTLVDLVTLLGEAYRQKLTEATYGAYRLALDDVPIEQIEVAVKQALKTSKFMPTPAELRELAGVITIADRATLVWSKLERMHLTAWEAVSFDDPVINATIRHLGGLITFVDRWKGAEQVKWLRKEFIEVYQQLARTGVDGEMCRPLQGLASGSAYIDADGNRVIGPPRVTHLKTGLPQLPGVKRVSHDEEYAPVVGSIIDQKKLQQKRVS